MTSQDYANTCFAYYGVHEGSSIHHALIDEYNKIKPLPRGYKLKYTDSWCAGFLSAIAHMAGIKNFPYECSVQQMYNKAITMGTPVSPEEAQAGDIIFFDWGHNGSLDHVGAVWEIEKNVIATIEGNKADAVGCRYVIKTSNDIAHIIRLKCFTNNSKYHDVALRVIRGDYGNGKARETKLRKLGYNPKLVQNEVNKILNSK